MGNGYCDIPHWPGRCTRSANLTAGDLAGDAISYAAGDAELDPDLGPMRYPRIPTSNREPLLGGTLSSGRASAAFESLRSACQALRLPCWRR